MSIRMEEWYELDLALFEVYHNHIKKFKPGVKIDFSKVVEGGVTSEKDRIK